MAQSFNLTARINLQGPYNLRPIISKIKKDIGGIKPQLKFKLDPAAAKSVKSVTAEIKKLDAAAKSAKKSVGSLNSQLSSLASSFNAAATASKNAANATNAATRATANAAKTVNQARTTIEEFGKQSGLAIKRFAAFTSVTTVIYSVTNAVTDAYKEFLVFNKELVRLSQVTNKSVGDLQGISNEITRLSTSLGVTSSDLISVASTLAQAGLSAQDTKIALEALAKSALAPSFEDITQTTEGAIAAIRQFGLETRELDSALGSINAVAAAFAVEAGDIIAAIQRTGGVFASASRGVSEGTDALNEFVAIFTSIRQTTRESAETIATGLRTIFTRIQRSPTIELLKQYGVELRDLEGKFVGPYEAVRRLSEGLSKIDPRSADFARISEELGGFRQIGKVIPLIQQFAVAQDALKVAQQGSGSLTKDVIIAQQSLAVQFEKTRQNFLALIREIGDSNSFKVFVGSTLVFTNALIDLGRILKPLLPLLLTFTAIKAGSGLNQFLSGFGLVFGRGGGSAGGTGGGGTPPTGGGGGGSGGNQPLTSALALNVAATNSLVQATTTLNTSVLALNQNLLNRSSSPPGFATGGLVPGTGNRDTVPARLMPGEFVIRKSAVEAIGAENLAQMNSGGMVQKYGLVRKYGKGSPGGVKEKTEKEEIDEILKDIFGSKFKNTYIEGGAANIPVRSLKIGRLPPNTGNIPRSKLEQAQKKIQDVMTNRSLVEEQKKEVFNKKRQDLIDSDKIFKFGLAGLRFGTTAQDKWTGEIPPSFVGLESVRETDKGIPVQIFAGALTNQLKQGEAKKLEEEIIKDFIGTVQKASANLGDRIKASPISDPDEINKRIQNAGISNVVGAALEASIGLLGAPYVAKEEKTKSIDFPAGLGASASLFGLRSDIPTDVTRTIGSPGKGITDYLKQIGRFLNSPLSSYAKYATGGSVKDTVPALLTPGEFVFSEPAAKRIGYGNLNRMNKAQGFNKGGVVGGPQKFAAGGSVTNDPAAIVAALTGILVPQVQRLAETFGKLQGDIGTFGTALQGIIRETSSTVLSASIALRTVGASETTIRRAQIGGGLAAAVGGGITDVSSKLLDKALQENTKAISKFDKSLQDYANASTEELRLDAAKKVEESFIALDSTIRNTKENIDQLENLKNFGQSINNVTLTILTTVTAMTALAQASARASAAVAVSKLPGAIVTGAAAVSTSTRLLAKFGTAIPVIGTVISLLSIGAEAFSFFSTKLKATDDQFGRLNQALRETINISQDYNLANENFVNNILPQFTRLVAQKPGDSAAVARQIGSLSENSLNLTRNFLVKQFARQQGLDIGTTETIPEAQQRVSGFTNLERVLTSSIEQANQRYIKEGFAAAMKERGLTDPTAIATEAEKLGGFDARAVQQIAIDYFGELDRRLLAERRLAQASSELKVNMINLSNTVDNLESIFNRSLSDLQINFTDLNRNIDILVDDIKVQTSTVLQKNIQILENLKQSTPQEISKALNDLGSSLGLTEFAVANQRLKADNRSTAQRLGVPEKILGTLQSSIPEEAAKTLGQISDAVQSNAILQQRTDIVLNKISQLGLQGDATKELLNEELKGILISSLGGGPGAQDTAATLINELAAAIQKGTNDGKPITSFQEAASRVEGFGSLLSELGNVTKSVVAITKIRQQAEQALVESINRELELRSKFTELSIQRSQTEIRNNISLKRTLGQRVSLEEINEEFLTQIRQLTTGTPGLSLSGGQITANEVNLIADELAKARAEIASRESRAGETGKLALQTDTSFRNLVEKSNNLNKALQETANAGILVSNTFEQIGKDKDLLKSQEQLLFELIRDSGDPVKGAELKRIVEAVTAVSRGTADVTQAQLAAERGVPLVTAARGQEAGEAFARNARFSFFNQVARFASTSEQAVAAQQVLSQLVAASQDLPEPAKTATEAQTTAQERLMQPVKESIDLTLKNTEEIFGNFNTNIKTRFEALLQILLDIQNRAQKRSTITSSESQVPLTLLDAIVGAIPRLTKILPVTTKARATQALEQVAGAKNITELENAVERLRQDILEFGRGAFELFPESAREERQRRSNSILKEFYERLDSFIPSTNIPNERFRSDSPNALPRSPDFNQGSFLDPSSKRTLEGFSTTTRDLATALTGENNTITQLADAVRTLTPVINTFKTAAEALANKIGPDGTITINQTAQSNVSVSFDEALQVDVPLDNRGNNAIVDNIRTIIQNEISGLRREIGLA